jgi:carbamate kinase
MSGQRVVSLICQTLVASDEPAFAHPTMFVGPIYSEEEGKHIAKPRGWEIRPDGGAWRSVVASPEPQVVIEISTIRTLLADGTVAICAGGGGIPVWCNGTTELHGVGAVVDKDLTAALLAHQLDADALVLLADVAGIERDIGNESAQVIRRTNPRELRDMNLPTGSMGPKVEAVCRFAEATGKQAMIGRLEDVHELIEGNRGTLVEPAAHKSPLFGDLSHPHIAASCRSTNAPASRRHQTSTRICI